MTIRIQTSSALEQLVWNTALEVAEIFAGIPWVLVGAQMVMLLEHEAGLLSGRTTGDVDAIVDVRAMTGGTRAAAGRLIAAGFELSDPRHPYRFSRGLAQVDLLAPDHLGDRVDLATVPPSQTVAIPGGSRALHDVREVEVEIDGVRTGVLPVPSLSAAIVLKVHAWEDRQARKDAEDIARLLGIIDDVEAVRLEMQTKDRAALARVAPLADQHHSVWRAAVDPDNALLAFLRITA